MGVEIEGIHHVADFQEVKDEEKYATQEGKGKKRTEKVCEGCEGRGKDER